MKFIITPRSKSLLITTVLILGVSIQAAAGNFTTYNMNEPFNNISTIPDVLSHHQHEQHDASFAITADAVRYKLRHKQKISLIDVRNPEDFERLHIPGSLNIPLHAVKTKVFLKSFAVVLINAGFHYRGLHSECRQLANLGFKAFILDGGIVAWERKGGRLVGDLFALQDMKTVSARVFLQEKDCETTLAFDISPVQTKIAKQLMPYSRHLPVSAEPGQWFRKFNRALTVHKNQPFLSVVIFNETGNGYDSVSTILAGQGVDAFFLQGGVAGYQKYLDDLMLSWLPRDRRIKTNSRCRTCSGEDDLEKRRYQDPASGS